ncbi:tRNA pseudouridine(13) synthase TruD [Archaeoglobus neptunius]|uniref:tRNA pseudouridine(13) synthase TruD n=1 Tax=Archaeoglobus neptunius TaxID=2798580 RepID=UPI0019254BD6|nr:tRNA pseudouridine(13) synthase TruD [Archaeoglobus neptunius]
MEHRSNSLQVEKIVGIEGYITRTAGMGGKIKEDPDDFYVEEIADLKLSEDGDYLILKVKKRNWDTLNFARVLSNALGISQKRVSFAGTKDKRALTVQYYAVKGVKKEDVERIVIKDAGIEVVGYSRRRLQLGDLLGNIFRVRVQGCGDGDIFQKTKEELEEKGTPNFFGLQRFGSVRYITHEVGKLILQGNYREAFWVYVAKPFKGENEEIQKIRRELWETRDPRYGLKELPRYLRYERVLLQKLREGKTEEGALLSLPKNLKMMFVHAYQSYIFNKLLSERLRSFGSLKEVTEGDSACYLTFKTMPTFSDCSEVSANLPRVRYLIKERIASLALPLVGYNSELKGWSRIALEFLHQDDLDLESFKTGHKEFSSSGSYRAADMLIEISRISFDGQIFEFYLPKGCYATVLLREFLKTELS